MTMRGEKTSTDPAVLALRALAWAVAEPQVGPRLLELTGLEVAELRQRAGDPALLAAVLAFIEGHEPDLVACATALDVAPGDLVAARQALEV